jgi:uncharacterized membrane protein (UPF0182 family)
MRARSWLVATLATLAVLLLAGRGITALVVDRAWFAAMGLAPLWRERVVDTVLLQGGAWLAGTLFTFGNLQAVRGTILAVAVPARVANLELTAIIPSRRLVWVTVVLAAAVGLALAAPLTDWSRVALVRHGVPFGEYEGYLDRDLGFYVYWLPLEETLYLWALVAVVTVSTMVLVFYALTRSLRLDGRRVVASTHVRRHLSVLGAVVLLLLAWSFRLDAFDLLRDGSGPDGLFMRVDHVVTLRVDLALSVLAAIAAPVLLRAGWLGQPRLALVVLSLVLALSLGLRQLLPVVLARGDRIGDPGRREVDYLATRALVSRRAFDVEGVRRVPVQGPVPRVPLRALGRVAGAWEPDQVREATAGGRAMVDAASMAWTATPDGRLGALLVRRPAVAGEEWRVTLVDAAGDVLREVPSPAGTSDDDPDGPLAGGEREPLVAPGVRGHRVVRDADGTVRGARLRDWGIRVAHAWDTRDPSLLRDDRSAGAPATIVLRRDIRERVAAIAPVFAQGSDVLPLLHGGRLYWTLELYAASDAYPLSQRWLVAGAARSYFRHAATALVESWTGRVQLIPAARPDPVARTWMALVPALFVDPGTLPAGLLAQLPPLTDGALAQLRTLARYGSRTERAEPRHLPDSVFAGGGPPGHLLAVDGRPTPAWSVPLVDGRDQVAGIATVAGGAARGTWWDPAPDPGLRWSATTERLRVALDSARGALPDGGRRDPRLRRGRPHALMTDAGPVVLQALAATRGDGSPTVVAVALALEDRLVVGRTMADAVAATSGATLPLAAAPAVAAPPEAPGTLGRWYDTMRDALRRGDWARFGSAFDSLGAALGRRPEPR